MSKDGKAKSVKEGRELDDIYIKEVGPPKLEKEG